MIRFLLLLKIMFFFRDKDMKIRWCDFLFRLFPWANTGKYCGNVKFEKIMPSACSTIERLNKLGAKWENGKILMRFRISFLIIWLYFSIISMSGKKMWKWKPKWTLEPIDRFFPISVLLKNVYKNGCSKISSFSFRFFFSNFRL